jgi:hypothetical protein
MFAKVVNYHWSFLPDGSYDITLDLVSIGDIIESFKINILNAGIVNAQSTTKETDVTKLSDQELITLYANKSSIGQWFYTLMTPEITKGKTEDIIVKERTKPSYNTAKVGDPNAL